MRLKGEAEPFNIKLIPKEITSQIQLTFNSVFIKCSGSNWRVEMYRIHRENVLSIDIIIFIPVLDMWLDMSRDTWRSEGKAVYIRADQSSSACIFPCTWDTGATWRFVLAKEAYASTPPSSVQDCNFLELHLMFLYPFLEIWQKEEQLQGDTLNA